MYCVVMLTPDGKEFGRSNSLEFERAIKIVRNLNRVVRSLPKHRNTKQVAYVEEIASVRHLPVTPALSKL